MGDKDFLFSDHGKNGVDLGKNGAEGDTVGNFCFK